MNINLPNNQASMFKELEARVRTLEGTARGAMANARFAGSTPATPAPTVYGAWEDGTASGATYLDDRGAVGPGYASLTCTTGRRALLTLCLDARAIGSDAGARTDVVEFGIGINGSDPAGITTGPAMFSRWKPGIAGTQLVERPLNLNVMRDDLVSGVNLFKVWVRWSDNHPAGWLPAIANVHLVAIPFAAG